ncbi:MAG: aminoglycoside phosphotransferase family protein [Chloroflexota bacterium]|nr:aminoglycoside phosphotransferase family protein [Chloroflexota bacterium]
MDNVASVAAQFVSPGNRVTAQPYGAGNVNDTFLVTAADSATQSNVRFILQRINTHVFHQPALIVANLRALTDHVNGRLSQEQGVTRRWEVPTVIATRAGQDYFVDETGAFWRAISLVEGAKTYPTIHSVAHAGEAGYALGRFQSLISDLDTARLHDTLPGFHITPQYLAHYDQVLVGYHAQPPGQGARRVDEQHCFRFVGERRHWAGVLEDALAAKRLTLRAIHGDPKVDNILIDDVSGAAVSIVDLDTVKPGLVHYDVGDCLRSCCNPAGEETTNLDAVTFDTDLCQTILAGYFEEAHRFFTANDYAYLFDSIRLIAFELGLRFFTDYLAGNVYFKAKHAEHNLDRALVQFTVVAQVEAQEATIRKITEAHLHE